MGAALKFGERLHQCQDCKEKFPLHWTECERSSRPHCPRCGCTRIDPLGEVKRYDKKKTKPKAKRRPEHWRDYMR